ncbi:alpha/beta hydrolase [Micromonospora echinospora]|uniref:alpha/beta hydrolase n=1 Tax=Micromonospora echinospora TaxID=1877 RepID=UPI003A897E5C
MRPSRSLTAATIAGLVLAGLAVPPVAAAPARPGPPDRTGVVEVRRVDRVPTPRLDWSPCYENAECATVRLPLDYDEPHGPTTDVAVLRVKARDQQQRIGSLFVNPGGPGGSGIELARSAPYFLGDEVLDRFDVVGFDPRGIGASEQVRCFRTTEEQAAAYAGMSVYFPWTRAEERAYETSSAAVGRACSTTGRPISGAMSTAEVARDMEVLRRAVGDPKLNYLGFSYGSVLGQYYANMFPDRVRAVAIDGVLSGPSWVGRRGAAGTSQEDRMRSGAGAHLALREILDRCAKAGPTFCSLAAGDPAASFDLVARRLQAKPLIIEGPDGPFTFTYADFVANLLVGLYDPDGYVVVDMLTAELLTLTDPGATAARYASASTALRRQLDRLREQTPRSADDYQNGFEAFLGVDCTDAYHPASARNWSTLADRADRRDPYFGRPWTWNTSACARSSWTVRDEDAYTGPFDRRTIAPVLLVGNYWDPATAYQQAVRTARLLPNSRLLSSDSWGHSAYGTSACVNDAVDAYLLTGALPAEGTVCVGDVQPFTPTPAGAATRRAGAGDDPAPGRGEPKRLPPVVAPLPVSTLG